ncbi:putative zinc-type alcohol dehydrogenase-like protein [Pseudoduganella lurida]|uniref:Putative zinc-type alcohol dehydrogenase-like protein n=1 Tax=Pseudoduganella lurida TaxID=1036180 RepID=A0A562R8P2_9BURK|nr:NAD(P)-dependent alcohol dehydrogenase [Pseudoduganella lurida]TWI65412.1 putative zinc-type alcohol dehydrogenase-like protein [Pseudoduganella lurida]
MNAPATNAMTPAYAALERNGPLVPWQFERRAPRPDDVVVKVLYCGVCHSDLHATGKWGQSFPLVPGHEIVGEVTAVGSAVSVFGIGDRVMIGVIVDSCRVCQPCRDHMEVYCREFPTQTFDGVDRVDGTRTRGGYSARYVADQRFVYPLPANLDPAAAAPLLCAGVTTYSPLKHWNVGPGMTVGVVGIGGLGHLAVKFARALGAHVVAFTTSPAKVAAALALGAHEAVLSTDETQMAAQAYRFDFILDTVSTTYPMTPMIQALKLDATLCSLGIPDRFDFAPLMLTMGRRRLASSGAAGTADTHDMLAFCSAHGIVADVEVIAMDQINKAFGRLARGDVRYRFVIDMATLAP